MPDTLQYQKELAGKLLNAIAFDHPDMARPVPPAVMADVVTIALRRLIGQAVAHYEPGPERQAFKQALVPMLGYPAGQLLTGMDDLHVAACLEGHAQILATTLGATPMVSVSVSSEPSRPSHLKVVQ